MRSVTEAQTSTAGGSPVTHTSHLQVQRPECIPEAHRTGALIPAEATSHNRPFAVLAHPDPTLVQNMFGMPLGEPNAPGRSERGQNKQGKTCFTGRKKLT